MLSKIKSIVKNYLVKSGYYRFDSNVRISYSQMGEDLFLESIFMNKTKGFFVDVGAFDPKLYSNTYLFYLKGWNGINIDARPRSMEQFKKNRPRDINIEAAISNNIKEMTYFMSDAPALNTLSKKRAKEIPLLTEYKIIGKKNIKTKKLREILSKYIKKGTKIDFLNIDVEGLDMEVLKSNDWHKFVPSVIIVESLKNESSISKYLKAKGYVQIGKLNVSIIYQLKK